MAKVRRKKQMTARTEPMGVPLPTARTGMIGAQIPSARTGMVGPQIPSANLMGAQPVPSANLIRPEGMNQEIEAVEMRNQGAPAAAPAPMPKTKVKRKKSSPAPTEPMSPQTWVNIGNNPADYPDYLAAWKRQSGKK